MRRKRFLRAALAAALVLTAGSPAYTASAPSGPSITVYSSPT